MRTDKHVGVILYLIGFLFANQNFIAIQVLRQIDNHTDMVYNVTGEAGGGMVSSR